MNGKAPPDRDELTRTEDEGATLDLPEGVGGIAPGQVLGERYQVLELLGRGGMGEVWHAFDLKLRVEVALKALREDLFKSERRLELLRQEVRAAREVVSPNVCRIFDLIEVEGRELVSMEYVDGATLLGVLQERGPLELKEAQDIASQFLAGLEAIHKAGLIHRDIKPENIMLTRAGRVVVMDFGLARQETEGGGSVSGTPAYMAPEQAAGQTLDARADVYAAGVVLAEMVSPEGIKSYQSRQSIWEGVRSEPAKLPDTPWAQVIKKAVTKDREGRYHSAHTLTRALEDVTLRVEGAEDLHPYPGLASFTEADAEYFFGREAEVEQMWRKLEGPQRMLGLVGPSGAGKTSFLQAGLMPAATAGWARVVCTPGSDPRAALRRAVISQLEGDQEALRELAEGSDDASVSAVFRWRRHHEHAVLIVDQFEELFTQNTPEEQHRFAALLGRLILEADVFVLLSMRDDFLIHCNRHESLRPLFSELTPLDPPSGAALRRALTQPALQCGYRFEDEELVDEMLAEVEGERGALPLLAFAAARLWEKRDRETGLLTRQAYHDIGGVGGALARHAEATIDRIGSEHIGIVRELFRNLVTAEGTRAVREWDELLSVFCDSSDESQAAVLSALIDARLLTSYEVKEDERPPTRRLEIIHESLLANWPRLVRWQTQDQEGAQLRDELRQAARAWDEHGRHDDRLWTGTAFREYALWRERYPGGLSDVEEAFAKAMASFANRRRRMRRIAVAAAFAALLIVLAVVGTFWHRSVLEARRAEAANLISLGQLELESYPSSTIAHVIASLEAAESEAARLLALEALWKGPSVFVTTEEPLLQCAFSPDGRWILQSRVSFREGSEGLLSIIRAEGGRTHLGRTHSGASVVQLISTADADRFVSYSDSRATKSGTVVVWSVLDERPLVTETFEDAIVLGASIDAARQRAVVASRRANEVRIDSLGFDTDRKRLGTLDLSMEDDQGPGEGSHACLDPQAGRWLGLATGSAVYGVEIAAEEVFPPRLIGHHAARISGITCDPKGQFLATADSDGAIKLWSFKEPSGSIVLQGPADIQRLSVEANGLLVQAIREDQGAYVATVWDRSTRPPRRRGPIQIGKVGQRLVDRWDHSGRRLATISWNSEIRVRSIDAPSDAEPVRLLRGDIQQIYDIQFHPHGMWLASADTSGLGLWPLSREYPLILRGHQQPIRDLVFAPDGSWLGSSSLGGRVRLWPLGSDPSKAGREIGHGESLAVSPDGTRILAGTGSGGPLLFSSQGGPPTQLPGFEGQVVGLDFSPDGRLAAATGGLLDPEERAIRLWDVESGKEILTLDVGERTRPYDLFFTDNEHVLSTSESGLLEWDIESGTKRLIRDGDFLFFAVNATGQKVALIEMDDPSVWKGRVLLLDFENGTETYLDEFGDDVVSLALDSTGSMLVAGEQDGQVRVGQLGGSDPHLLLGHEGGVLAVAFDPLDRWVVSGGHDNTIRLWPMPDLSKPPLHTLPREELIAKLKTLTNLRVVRDPESATGWKLTHDPFPGWETVPTW